MSFKRLTDSEGSTLGYLPETIAMAHVYATLTGTGPTLDPADGDCGTMPMWTMEDDSAPLDGLVNGQLLRLHLWTGGYAITWPTSTDVGSWPELDSANVNVIELWKVGGTLYRRYLGAGVSGGGAPD